MAEDLSMSKEIPLEDDIFTGNEKKMLVKLYNKRNKKKRAKRSYTTVTQNSKKGNFRKYRLHESPKKEIFGYTNYIVIIFYKKAQLGRKI